VSASAVHIRRLPAVLVVLLAVATVEFAAWSVAVPALQEPDEASHFSYVQTVAENGRIPFFGGHSGPRGDLSVYSGDLRTAAIWGGLWPLLANPAARPLWTQPDEALWRAHASALGPRARKGIEPSSAFANPPLAYLYDAIPYKVAGGSFFDRDFVLRWANLPWLLIVVAATWALGRELFPRRPALAALATGLVALQPLLVSIAGGVTPDLLLAAIWATGIAVAVRTVRRGLTARRVAALVALPVLAAATHGRGLPLAVPAALAIILAWWRAEPRPRLAARRAVGAATIGVCVVGAVAALHFAERGWPTIDRTRGFASYLWQFYLPRLPGTSPPPFRGWGVRQVFVDRLYGTFGQLEISLAAWVTDVLAWVLFALLVAGVVALVARRRTARPSWPTFAVLASGVIAELLLLHLQAYNGLLDDPTDPVITGRYLLPMLPIFAVGVAALAGSLPRRVGAAAGGVALGGAVLLQLAAVGAMFVRFYA
jgi:hypothetical protein